jgi:hypothetical protein
MIASYVSNRPLIPTDRAPTGNSSLAARVGGRQPTQEANGLQDLINVPPAAVTARQVSHETALTVGGEVVVEVPRGELDDGAALESDHGVTRQRC